MTTLQRVHRADAHVLAIVRCVFLYLGLLSGACGARQQQADQPQRPALTVRWPVDSLSEIGSYAVTPAGDPKFVSAENAMCFDGVDDALTLPINPLAGQYDFTVEVLFKPEVSTEPEQKLVHLESEEGGGRVILETRPFADGTWHLHSFVRTEATKQALSASRKRYPLGDWYWAALTYSDGWLRHYVNGEEVGALAANLNRMESGQMSVATRINMTNFFKGCISELRFANQGLPPDRLAKSPADATVRSSQAAPADAPTRSAPTPTTAH